MRFVILSLTFGKIFFILNVGKCFDIQNIFVKLLCHGDEGDIEKAWGVG